MIGAHEAHSNIFLAVRNCSGATVVITLVHLVLHYEQNI